MYKITQFDIFLAGGSLGPNSEFMDEKIKRIKKEFYKLQEKEESEAF